MGYQKRDDIDTYLYRLTVPWRDTEELKPPQERKRVPITRLGHERAEELESQLNEQLLRASTVQGADGQAETWLGRVHGILEERSPSQVLVVDIELPRDGGPYARTRFVNALLERRLSYHVTLGDGERVPILMDLD
jgi:hypothetical protein